MYPKIEKKLAKQKAKEEMIVKMRKETLERERVMDIATLQKMKDKWFESFIDSKVPQMQDNLKHILHYMEKLIEAESFRKLLFENERQNLEEDCTLLAQAHGSAMEILFDIYQKRIRDMNDVYIEVVNTKKQEVEEEFNNIDEKENMTQDNMQTMFFQMREDRDKKEGMMNFSMFLKLDDERSKNTEVKESLRTKLEKKMEKRWGEISSTLNKYEESTKDRRKEYMLLKVKDDIDCKIISHQMKKTQKLFEQLDELKKCLDECYAPKETISLIKDTREERMKFFNTFKKLKLVVEDEIKQDEINLKTLSVVASSVTKEMKELCKKGENILTLYRICQRLETEQEKVMPVGDINIPKNSHLTEQKKFKTTEKALEKETDKNVTGVGSHEHWTQDIEVLEKFWRKVGKIQISKMALMKCIKNMEQENKFLKQILTSYLHEASQKR